MKESKSLLTALGLGKKAKDDDKPKDDVKVQAAKAVREALEAEDDEKLSEALAIHYDACKSSKKDEKAKDDDEDEDY